jgi:hypothetical protein
MKDTMRSSTATALLLAAAACLAGVNARQLAQRNALKVDCIFAKSAFTICYVHIKTDGPGPIFRACMEFADRHNGSTSGVTCGVITRDSWGDGKLVHYNSSCYVHISTSYTDKCKVFTDFFYKQGVPICDDGIMTSDKLSIGSYTPGLPVGGADWAG